jgi:hypothetical protein
MAKIQNNRLQDLKKRREFLIELNSTHHFTQSSHPKIDKYYRCILYIRKEINNEECKRIANRKENLKNSNKAIISLTRQFLYNQNAPV